ncbi:MAG: alpha/beta hydrolase [Anaerolineae bacterium]|nr:alpha/beta hydrolase [Anaerolineae bacterium]
MVKRWLLGLLVVALLALGAGAALAQDVNLTPFEDETFGFNTLVPEGWQTVAPGVRTRASTTTDFAVLAQQSAPLSAADLLPSILPQLGLTEAPESVGTYSSAALNWTLYKIDVAQGGISVTVDLALAETEGRTYIVLLQAAPEEYDALHASVFVPVLDALAPRVEAPAEDVPYLVEEVTFANGDITLAGTLTLPATEGPAPAVVLVTGSGPQDRDESLLPVAAIKPFALIADALTRAGIAVLRYDDRGVGESTGDFDSATSADFATDAAAAITYLKGRPEINAAEIGVLGHSEGGMVASILGVSNPDIAFIISLAGPSAPITELMLKQNERILQSDGASAEAIESQLAYLREAFPLAVSGDTAALETLTYETTLAQTAMMSEEERTALGDIEAFARNAAEQAVATLATPWFRYFLTSVPADDWSRISVPVLAIYGGLDVQVDAEQNVAAFEAAMQAGGNPDYQVVTFPNANHLMQAAVTGSLNEYGTLEQTFIPELMPTIIEWLLARVTVQAAS